MPQPIVAAVDIRSLTSAQTETCVPPGHACGEREAVDADCEVEREAEAQVSLITSRLSNEWLNAGLQQEFEAAKKYQFES